MRKAGKTGRIDIVDGRSALAARDAPYWRKLASGCHIGYRKLTPTTAGTWVARAYDAESRKQVKHSLGSFDHLPAHQRFDAAKVAAEEWFRHMGRGGSADPVTVKQACQQYVAHIRGKSGIKPEDTTTKCATADDAKARFARWVYHHKIAGIRLPKLTRRYVDAWRQDMAGTLVIINPHAEKPDTRERSGSSINRDMTALRAALNFAHDNGAVTTDMAWRVALRPIQNADRRRNAYLDRTQRKALIEKVPADVGRFLRALSLVPLRPGALASLTAGSFDKRLKTLTVGKDKAGKDRQIRLPNVTAAFFEEQAKDKLPSAPLLRRANGAAWTKDAWKKPIKEAAKAAELSDAVTAYAMRHSVITDLVTGGLDLLTVAQLSGTSVAMIERHYGHFRADIAEAALANLVL